MSDTVDNVLNTVSEATASGADEPDVVVEEATEAVDPVEEAVDEAVEPVSASEAEEAPVVHQPQPEPEPEPVVEPVSTQEVVQNVQEILSSTETNVTVDNSELEERVKFLEERVEKLIDVLKNSIGDYRLRPSEKITIKDCLI